MCVSWVRLPAPKGSYNILCTPLFFSFLLFVSLVPGWNTNPQSLAQG